MLNNQQKQQSIQEFKQIYLEEFGIHLSDKEASQKAIALLQLFEALTPATEAVS